MNRKGISIAMVLLLLSSAQLFAQLEDPTDPGGDLPIPGILYFLFALLGIGLKKIYNAHKKN